MKKRFVILATLVLMVLCLAGCAGNGGEGAPAGKQKEKTYVWNDVAFTVKSVKEAPWEEGEEGKKDDRKRVAVILDFGKATIPQDKFESNVSKGNILLAGKKPATYNYSMTSMVFSPGTGGFIAQMTGEATLFFEMPLDYEVSETDLVIGE